MVLSVRPPLNKKMFPVHRPGGLKRANWDFFFMIFEKTFFFLNLLYILVNEKLRIDYCDEHLIQWSSYISGTIPLIHVYHISYEPQYYSLLDHTSKNEVRHKSLEK